MPTWILRVTPPLWLASWVVLSLMVTGSPVRAADHGDNRILGAQLIPILATALDRDKQPVGVVAELEVAVEGRDDDDGLDVRFGTAPGRFSRMAQVAVVAAISNLSRVAHLDTDSLTVSLTLPYRGVTVYGTSLSAMVGLTVIALSQGDSIIPQRVVTGTIEPDGHIGAVGGIALKLQAAYAQRLHRVIVPEEYDAADGDWRTPFLLHVSPVGTVTRAYQVLTGRSFPGLDDPDAHVGVSPYAGSRSAPSLLSDKVTPRAIGSRSPTF